MQNGGLSLLMLLAQGASRLSQWHMALALSASGTTYNIKSVVYMHVTYCIF